MRACVASSYSRNSNSASLNRHIALTYRLDLFSPGFVEILAAELTFESSNWFQGTADAVRRAMRHFVQYQADYYMILAGDHLYRMDFGDLVKSHVDSGADITIAAHPVSTPDATEMGIFSFDDRGQIVGFEEKPSIERLAALHASAPTGSIASVVSPERPHVASMGIYLFSRQSLISALEQHDGIDFGREIIPQAIGGAEGSCLLLRRLLGRRRHGGVVLCSEPDAHAPRGAVQVP